jgi:hypothetical protein
LSQTYLYVGATFTDGVDASFTNQVLEPVNLLLHSLFSQVDVSLNDILVTSSVNTYAYRSMIDTLLNYGEDAKKTHLQSALFYKDTPGFMETLEVDLTKLNTSNLGWLKRREIMGKKNSIDMFGRIHADIFFQDRYLLNNVEMKIRLSRNKSTFCYIGDAATNKVKIKRATLYVRKAKINPDVMLAHAYVLEKTTAKYPIRRIETKVVTLGTGIRNTVNDNIST